MKRRTHRVLVAAVFIMAFVSASRLVWYHNSHEGSATSGMAVAGRYYLNLGKSNFEETNEARFLELRARERLNDLAVAGLVFSIAGARVLSARRFRPRQS